MSGGSAHRDDHGGYPGVGDGVEHSKLPGKFFGFCDFRLPRPVISMEDMIREAFDPPLDPGIVQEVEILRTAGIETFESCQGGPGHAYPEPTVRFHGDPSEGFLALAAALRGGLRVAAIRRAWPVIDGEPTGPWWEMTFYPTKGS